MTRTPPPKHHHHISRCSASSKRARASRVRRTCGAHHTARDNAAAAIHAAARSALRLELDREHGSKKKEAHVAIQTAPRAAQRGALRSLAP